MKGTSLDNSFNPFRCGPFSCWGVCCQYVHWLVYLNMFRLYAEATFDSRGNLHIVLNPAPPTLGPYFSMINVWVCTYLYICVCMYISSHKCISKSMNSFFGSYRRYNSPLPASFSQWMTGSQYPRYSDQSSPLHESQRAQPMHLSHWLKDPESGRQNSIFMYLQLPENVRVLPDMPVVYQWPGVSCWLLYSVQQTFNAKH